MQNFTAAARSYLLNLTSAAFLFVVFLTGIASALQTPTMSLFLTEEVQARPVMVGFFFSASAVISIFVSLLLAHRSDRHWNRKALIFICCLLGALACLLFAWNRNYFILLCPGLLLSSFGYTANTQIFALAREYADRTGREAAMFCSMLRAQVSLAWVVGPPLAYSLVISFGFVAMYLSAGAAFIICAILVCTLLPGVRKRPVHAAMLEAPRRNRHDVLLLCIICTLMWGANCLYIITMPLYIVDALQLPETLAGAMMGTAAGLEIPTMLITGYYARKYGKRGLLRIAILACLLFYLGMAVLSSPLQLLCLQLLNAIDIGILAGIGMLYFQDLMPAQPGAATTLYCNTVRVGWIIAGSLAGVTAELWGYHAVFYVALMMGAVAGGCLWRIRAS